MPLRYIQIQPLFRKKINFLINLIKAAKVIRRLLLYLRFMKIILQQVYPSFLDKELINHSQIWTKELCFSAGENIQIVAPSGSGKTSLIYFLYGLRNDYEGNIFFDEKNIRSFSPEDWATYRSEKISIMFQDLRLFPQLNGAENIEIKRAIQPFHNTVEMINMAKDLGIQNKLQQKTETCSYGEKQRIATVRSLQQPFEFLLMDEPFSHLDEVNRQKSMQLLQEEATRRNAGIILADLKPIEFFKPHRTLYL